VRTSPTALRTLLASTLVLVAAVPAAPKYSTTLIGVRADAEDYSFLAVIRGSKHSVARCQKAHQRAGGRFEGQLTVRLTFERGNATRTSTLVPTEEAADLAACTLVALVGLRVAPDWPGETADLTFDFRSDSEPVHPRSPAPWEAAEEWLNRVCTSREPVETLGPGTRRTVRCQNANDAGPIGWFLDQGRMVVKSQARVDFDHSPVASLSRAPILVPEDVERGTHIQAPGPPAACLAKVTVAVPFDTCMTALVTHYGHRFEINLAIEDTHTRNFFVSPWFEGRITPAGDDDLRCALRCKHEERTAAWQFWVDVPGYRGTLNCSRGDAGSMTVDLVDPGAPVASSVGVVWPARPGQIINLADALSGVESTEIVSGCPSGQPARDGGVLSASP
jgi:hypothetical protein